MFIQIHRRTPTAPVGALLLTLIFSGVTQAEEEDAATSGNDVVVSARRREERLQDVPLAITVLSEASLAASGTHNPGQLAERAPSIQFYSSNSRNSALTIRGLGSPFGLTNDGIEPGVGLYVDQVYIARPAGATLDFLDVERVEELRGPQGTLYGKNTTAGALNVVTRAPSFTPEATADLSFGNLEYKQARASLSGPLLGDVLAVRVGASYTNREGTIYDVTSGRHINDEDNLGFKGQLLLRVSDRLRVTLSGDYTSQNPNGFGQIYVGTGLTQRPLGRQYAALAAASGNYRPPSFDPFDRLTDLDAPLAARQSAGGVSLVTEWQVGPGRLTSVSAWRRWTWDPGSDRDYTGLPITTLSQNPSREQQWSQELRFAATANRIDYVVGLYAFHESIDTTGAQEQGALASRWLLSGANAGKPAILDGLRSDNGISMRDTSAAVFGQLTFHLTDRIQVLPGLRFNYDEKHGRYLATVTNATHTALTSAQLGVLAPQSYAPVFHETHGSGDLALTYQLAPQVLSYLKYARSFKPGGINLSGLPLDAHNAPITGDETVRPEAVNHFEGGLKSELLEHRAVANVALFWTEVKDFQTTVTNSQVNVIRGYLANADKVRVRGVELDLSGRPAERLSAYLSGAFTDARYVLFPDAPCPPELSGGPVATAAHPPSAPGTPGGYSPAFCDVSGQWLPGVSRVALAYGAELNTPGVPAWQGTVGYLGFDGSYRSKFSSNASRSAYTDVGAYALANFRAGLRMQSGWEVYAWVRNAFDREYFQFLATQSGNTGLIVGQPGDPRTYGVTIRLTL